MKAFFVVIVIIFMALTLKAQDDTEIKTLLGSDIKYGIYGGFDMRFSNFDNKAGLMLGGKGGIILNHQIAIGGGGYGLSNRARITLVDDLGNDSIGRLNFGYGGVLIEYIAFPTKPVHFSVPFMIGSGSAKIYSYDAGIFDNSLIEASTFLLLEPGIDIELNMLSFMRFGIGASYRLVSGTFMRNLNDKDLSGLSINVSFKFGYF